MFFFVVFDCFRMCNSGFIMLSLRIFVNVWDFISGSANSNNCNSGDRSNFIDAAPLNPDSIVSNSNMNFLNLEQPSKFVLEDLFWINVTECLSFTDITPSANQNNIPNQRNNQQETDFIEVGWCISRTINCVCCTFLLLLQLIWWSRMGVLCFTWMGASFFVLLGTWKIKAKQLDFVNRLNSNYEK